MGLTHLPHGVSSFGIPQVSNGDVSIPSGSGKVIFVDAERGNDGQPGDSPDSAFATIQRGINACTSGAGDTVYVYPGSYNENISVIGKDYVTIVGAIIGGYARPDVVPDAGVPITVTSQGTVIRHMRFAGTAADAVVQRGNGFIYEDCVFDGDLTAAKAGLRLQPSSSDDAFTASEGNIRGNLFRGSAFGLVFDTGAAPVGVGTTHNKVSGNTFQQNTVDVATADTGVGVYSAQYTDIGPFNVFEDNNKAVYIDMTTANGGGSIDQGGMIFGNWFNTAEITATNVKIAGTTFCFTGNSDISGVVNGNGQGTVDPVPPTHTGPLNLNLVSAAPFGIMATSSITSTGATLINGDVALAPGTSQGIPPAQVNGSIHVNDATAAAAQADLLAAYNDAVSRTASLITVSGDIGGTTKAPGLYGSTSSLGITGALTLDAAGDTSATWIFKMASTLTTAPASSVVLLNGAQAKNVWWQVGSSATLDTTTIFKGTILAAVTITANTGATVEGRLFAGSAGGAGSITLDANTVTVPV